MSCYGSMTQGGGKAATWEREIEERSESWIIWGEEVGGIEGRKLGSLGS